MEKKIRIFVFFLFLALFLRLFIFYFQKTDYKDGDNLSFESTIFTQPKVYPTYQTFSLETPTGESLLIKTNNQMSYLYGENVAISGNLNVRVLKNRTLLSMDYPKMSLVSKPNGILAVINFVRQKISDNFQKTLSPDDSALLLGIVFGIKQNMSQDFLTQLKTVGVMHVIAASGMNVTMTAGFIFYIFSIFLKRQIAIVATILGIIFYAMLAGFQASILRASIMAILAFSAQALGKQAYSLYALALTGFIMLFIWPRFLFDIGFQLSFLSTLGILYIPRLFSQKEKLYSADFFTTVSAQASTLPILLSNFGTYSIWSVLVNVLILWTVPILMILGGLAAISSFLFEPISKVLLLLSIPLLSFFEQVVRFFTGLGGDINVTNFPLSFSISYYLFFLAIIFYVRKRGVK